MQRTNVQWCGSLDNYSEGWLVTDDSGEASCLGQPSRHVGDVIARADAGRAARTRQGTLRRAPRQRDDRLWAAQAQEWQPAAESVGTQTVGCAPATWAAVSRRASEACPFACARVSRAPAVPQCLNQRRVIPLAASWRLRAAVRSSDDVSQSSAAVRVHSHTLQSRRPKQYTRTRPRVSLGAKTRSPAPPCLT